eukprot:TRINITY_DN16618_c0_g1_i2.p1 TRINITY_DN16618_c0_g1~~TRINITY_DN16618_c0_g1_i2.p1  ORF type:complete len:204 (-),score=19.50 TRINITY_DN16618_c0_g1_i2:352-963(-)
MTAWTLQLLFLTFAPRLLAGVKLAETSASPRTAVCFSGQFRSFGQVARAAYENVIKPWPKADVFMFLNLQDSRRGGTKLHSEAELDAVKKVLNPVSVKLYDFVHDYQMLREKIPSSNCFEKRGAPPGLHFSHHGPQFWGIRECFDMVKEYEQRENLKYDVVVRTRPDNYHGPSMAEGHASSSKQRMPVSHLPRHVWTIRSSNE